MVQESGVGIVEHRERRNLVIELSGELDAMSAPQLHERFEAIDLDKRNLEMVTIDLQHLDFIDSTGISAFIALHRRTDEHEVGCQVVNASDIQAQLFHLTGLAEYFGVNDGQ